MRKCNMKTQVDISTMLVLKKMIKIESSRFKKTHKKSTDVENTFSLVPK